jgi:peptidoglycan L-alanyl-D-glutamate endopeptidase CwlK
MAVLRIGASGPAVLALQKKLLKRGFNPGALDGEFGLGTEAALLAFQNSEGLVADGVAGPRTLAALEKRKPPALPSSASPCRSWRACSRTRRSATSSATCRRCSAPW